MGSSPAMEDIARVLEHKLGLKPGRNCIVGEGLATVDLGLFLEGKQVWSKVKLLGRPPPHLWRDGGHALLEYLSQVAVQLEEEELQSVAAAAAAGAAKRFAEDKTRRRVLQSFGWSIAAVSWPQWEAAVGNDHAKIHLIVDAVNKALGGGKGGHEHHSGCGCSH